MEIKVIMRDPLVENIKTNFIKLAETITKAVNAEIETAYMYPLGVDEIDWATDFKVHALYMSNGEMHFENCSGFGEESVVVFLFKETFSTYGLPFDIMPHYLLFDINENYPIGMAYHYSPSTAETLF